MILATFSIKEVGIQKKIKVNGNLMLSPLFTIQAWIKSPNSIDFFTKKNNNDEAELKITFESTRVKVLIKTFNYNETKTFYEDFTKGNWKSFIFEVIIVSGVLNLKINSEFESFPSIDYFDGILNNNCYIGNGGNHFWIYKFSLDQHLFNWDNTYSSPQNQDLSFIWKCDIKTYLNNGSCYPCANYCSTCRFSSKCSLCTVEFCSECDLDSGTTCNACNKSFVLQNNRCDISILIFYLLKYLPNYQIQTCEIFNRKIIKD